MSFKAKNWPKGAIYTSDGLNELEKVVEHIDELKDSGELKGDKGDPGQQGLRGEPGPVGPKGDKGDKGDTGMFDQNSIIAGGRNLLQNSAFYDGFKHWTNEGNSWTVDTTATFNGHPIVKSPTTTGSGSRLYQTFINPPEIGSTITISFNARGDHEGDKLYVTLFGLSAVNSGIITLTTAMKHYKFSAVVPSGFTTKNFYLFNNTAGSNIYVNEVKVENGNVGTDWSLSEEEVYSYRDTGKSQYYEEITYEKHLDTETNTFYTVISIPHYDKNGKVIKLKNGFAGDKFGEPFETIEDFHRRHKKASVIINAAPWTVSTGVVMGRIIANGVALQTSPIAWGNETLGLLETGELKSYTNSVGIANILADGVTDGWGGFFPIIQDHKQYNYKQYEVTYPNLNTVNFHQVIAQMDNLDLKIFSFGGLTKNRPGYSLDDVYHVISKYDPKFAYNLDGGGSTSTIMNGTYISDLKDNLGQEMRKVPSFIYFEKDDDDLVDVTIVDNTGNIEATKNGNAAFRKVFDEMISPSADELIMPHSINQIDETDIQVIANNMTKYRGNWKNATSDMLNVPTDSQKGHYTLIEVMDFSTTSGIIRISRYGDNKTWQAGINSGVISTWVQM